MATVTPTFTKVADQDDGVLMFSWALTTANLDGAPIEFPQWGNRCWSVGGGTWGGATLAFQGSNDGTNWFPLSNAAGGAAATLSADGGKSTIEVPRYVRPFLSTPGAGAVLTVVLCAVRQQPMRL